MKAYNELMAYQRQTEALGQISGRLGWDQETMMPVGAAPQRAEEMGAIEEVLHARRTDARIGDWLGAIDEAALDDVGRANIRHIRRTYERISRIPVALATKMAQVTSAAQRTWAEARANDDFKAFTPVLEEVVALKREEASALANGGDIYDALLDDYEPGATGAELQAMFDAMRPRLVALRDAAMGADHQPASVTGEFDATAQMKITRQLAKSFGYDMKNGRLDKAVHPFSSGSGLDVRITTRTSPDDPFNCFYSTIHEVGHAAYEQGINPDYLLTPLGQGVSMGVHESQSRIYENQLGRSRGFTTYLHAQMLPKFGEASMPDVDGFYGTVNKLHQGYIRTEADEVQYNLHVLLRFDLERKIIAGDLAIADLEEAWNSQFEADFGFAVDKASNGCLQDVHWSVGLFGYFPTYSLGNVYAGCLNKAMEAEIGDQEAALSTGDTTAATAWLRQNVQRHGGLYKPAEVIENACGFTPNVEPLLDYLEAKFGEIYRL